MKPKSTDKTKFFALLNAALHPPAKAGSGKEAHQKRGGHFRSELS